MTLTGTVTVDTGVHAVDERELGGRRTRIVFALLVLERDRLLSRRELADAVWPNGPPATWDAALRGLVSRVRAFLAAAGLDAAALLPSARDGYRLTLPPGTVLDLEVAASAVDRAETAVETDDVASAIDHAATAITIASRPLLPDDDHPRLDRARTELERVLLRALLVSSRAHERRGSTALAVAAAADAVSLAPFVESAHLRLVRAHAAGGDRAAALRAYERCRRALRDELGVQPSRMLEHAHRALLAEESASVPVPSVLDLDLPLPPWLAAGADTPLVGRRDARRRIEEAWTDVVDRCRPHLVLVHGEPGIGKTRLVAEVVLPLHAHRAAIVLGGRAEAPSLPFAPFVEALDRYARAAPAHLSALQEHRPVTVAVSGLVPSRTGAARPARDDATVAQAVALLLAALERDRPLVLALDDLQGADRHSLQLLRHLLCTETTRRLLVLATVTDTTPDATATATALAADVDGHAPVTWVPVPGLEPDEVAELMRAVASTTGAADVVHRRTAGNPLYVLQLVGPTGPGSAAAADAADGTLRRLVEARVARLGPPVRQVLEVAAVAGGRFDAGLVGTVAGLGDDARDEALATAERAHLIRAPEHDVADHAFVHDVVRTALVASLPATRRRGVHRQLGRALRDGAGDHDLDRWSRIAEHLAAASPLVPPEEARQASERAGRLAAARFGFHAAVDHHRRALALLDLQTADEPRRRCELEIGLASASARVGGPRRRDLLLAAAGRARDLGDQDLLARAALALDPYGRFTSFDAPDRDVVDVLQAAVASQDHQPARRARLLAALGLELMWTSEHRRSRSSMREAVELALRSDNRTLAEVLVRARLAPDVLEAFDVASQLGRLADRLGDDDLRLVHHQARFDAAMELGRTDEARSALAEASRLAERLHQPQHDALVALCRTGLALFRGQLEVAERLLDQGITRYRAAGATASAVAAVAAAQAFTLAYERDALAPWRAGLEELVRTQPAVLGWRAALALLDARAGHDEAVREQLATVAPDGRLEVPVNLVRSSTLLLLAEAASRAGVRELAEPLYHQLLPVSGRNAWAGAFSFGPVDRGLALLAALDGDRDLAVRHADAAAAQCRRWGAPRWERRCRPLPRG